MPALLTNTSKAEIMVIKLRQKLGMEVEQEAEQVVVGEGVVEVSAVTVKCLGSVLVATGKLYVVVNVVVMVSFLAGTILVDMRNTTIHHELRLDLWLGGPEQGIKLLGLLLTGSTGQHMASRNGLA